MVHRLSLRLRVFLFFALVALGGIAAVFGALIVGYQRLDAPPAEVLSAFVISGAIAGFVILGLVTWVWMLFDENVAQAVEHLAHDMRARAHADLDADLDHSRARYLGDLAPAAAAVASNLSEMKNAVAEVVGRETARVSAEKASLETILKDLPTGVVLCNAAHQVAFYNGRARALFPAGALRLDRALTDLVDPVLLREAYDRLCGCGAAATCADLRVDLPDASGRLALGMRLLEAVPGSETAPGYVLTIRPAALGDVAGPDATTIPREAIYDFDLLHARASSDMMQTPLDRLTFVVFDTETTGLMPDRGDEVCQIAAIRVVNGKRVAGEVFDTLVDPERRIPQAATNIHHITDDMVQGAPRMAEAGKAFHDFCQDSVLVAHNAPFDMAFFYRRQDEIGARFDHPVLDTVLLSAMLYGQTAEHSLDAIADRLQVTIPDDVRHTALGDAVATTDVFLKMLPMLKAQGVTTFGDAIAGMKKHKRLLADLN